MINKNNKKNKKKKCFYNRREQNKIFVLNNILKMFYYNIINYIRSFLKFNITLFKNYN